jgi:hypothetical protein
MRIWAIEHIYTFLLLLRFLSIMFAFKPAFFMYITFGGLDSLFFSFCYFGVFDDCDHQPFLLLSEVCCGRFASWSLCFFFSCFV